MAASDSSNFCGIDNIRHRFSLFSAKRDLSLKGFYRACVAASSIRAATSFGWDMPWTSTIFLTGGPCAWIGLTIMSAVSGTRTAVAVNEAKCLNIGAVLFWGKFLGSTT
jgi:hypothetical protein